MKMLILFCLLLYVDVKAANATTCVWQVTRTACRGQEEKSYSKCQGKKTCEKTAEVDSAGECRSVAVEACKNVRLDITKSKIITVKYNGEVLDNGKNFCKADRGDFNKCPEDQVVK